VCEDSLYHDVESAIHAIGLDIAMAQPGYQDADGWQ
jgi:hypothetical protein